MDSDQESKMDNNSNRNDSNDDSMGNDDSCDSRKNRDLGDPSTVIQTHDYRTHKWVIQGGWDLFNSLPIHNYLL